MRKPLPDHDARERIRRDLDVSLIVEAAAGTGKTTLLIERILNLVTVKHAKLTSIVAITFTRKAAGELKQKLRAELEARIQAGPLSAAATYRDALIDLDLMPVSTIDSFCFDLIRQLPVEAGVDPDVQILDEAAEAALKDEFWNDWLSRQLSRDCPPLQPFLDFDLALSSTNRELSLRSIFDALVNNADTLEAFHVDKPDEDSLRERLRSMEHAYLHGAELAKRCADPEDKLLRKYRSLPQWMARRPEGEEQELLGWLNEYVDVRGGNVGAKDNWGGKEQKEAFQRWLSEFNDLIAELRAGVFSRFADALVQWLKSGAREYEALKRERGRVGFHDLLVIARDLLRGSKSARAFFKARFAYLLVDEFQDTDPLQTEIIFFLAERAQQFAQSWEAVGLEPGKLFIVGDPKQSIYRFRRADLALYGQVKRKLQVEGRAETINVSFRGVKPLVGEINAIFAGPMTPPPMAEHGENQYEPDYVAMEPVREALDDTASVELLLRRADADEESSRAESAAIAEHILALKAGGRKVFDIETKAWRPLCFRDVAVLTRTWTHADALERELRAREIPFEMSSGRFFGQRAEILALRTVLAALDNPFDEMNVAGALRTPLFGVSDEELLLHRVHGSRFNYLSETNAAGRIGECFALLRELHEAKRERAVSELIQEILDRTHGAELLALKPRGETRVDNLRRLITFVRAIEADASLHTILRQLEEDGMLEAAGEGENADSGLDCVHVLSFHKAKGLEYPVVIVYGLGRRQNTTVSQLYDRDSGRFEFARESLRTSGFEHAKERERRRQEYEEMRLLYVALTRARDLLVLPVQWDRPDETKPRSCKSMLAARYPADGIANLGGGEVLTIDVSRYELNKPPLERLTLDFERPFDEAETARARAALAAWQAHRDEAAARLDRRARFGTASAQEASQREILFTPGEDGRVFGNFVHEALERVDFPDGRNLSEVLSFLRSRCPLPRADAAEAERVIRGFLRSDFLRDQLAGSGRVLRELPYAVDLNGVLYSGTMDLVFAGVDGAVIVDYKTNRSTNRDYLIGKYAAQCAVYARALEVVAGLPVREVVLYALRSNDAIRLSTEQLASIPLGRSSGEGEKTKRAE